MLDSTGSIHSAASSVACMQGRKGDTGCAQEGAMQALRVREDGEGERSKMAGHTATHPTVHTRARDRKVGEGGKGRGVPLDAGGA